MFLERSKYLKLSIELLYMIKIVILLYQEFRFLLRVKCNSKFLATLIFTNCILIICDEISCVVTYHNQKVENNLRLLFVSTFIHVFFPFD